MSTLEVILGIVTSVFAVANTWFLLAARNHRDDVSDLRKSIEYQTSQTRTMVAESIERTFAAYREDIDRLRVADHDMRNQIQQNVLFMTEKIGAIQLLVAGNYVTRDEFKAGLNEQTNTLLRKFDEFSKYLQQH